MASQDVTLETAGGHFQSAELAQRIAGTNVNPTTFLATDYLNHFNEIVMLLEMIPDMPDIVEEAKEWQPKSYAQHFLDSGLSDGAVTIEAYDNAPAEFRAPFDETVARMDKVVHKNIENIEAALARGSTDDELRLITATATRLLQRLMDAASAIIHGDTPNLDQREIDELLAD